jgi:benzoyl-CoA 2,3-epoxidase subunit A
VGNLPPLPYSAALLESAIADKVVRNDKHLIDPEICIRCNTCESTCPSGAITHDANNYVVDPVKCKLCSACIEPCPTGRDRRLANNAAGEGLPRPGATGLECSAGRDGRCRTRATLPPWSAAHAYTKLYDASNPVTATVTGNMRARLSTTAAVARCLPSTIGSN